MTNLESLIQLIDDGLIKIIFAREKLSLMRGQEDVFSASTSTSTKPVLKHVKCGDKIRYQDKTAVIVMTGWKRQKGLTVTLEFADGEKITVAETDPDISAIEGKEDV
jgi:hypothetical protein